MQRRPGGPLLGALRYGTMFRRKPAPPPASNRWLVIGLGNPGREYESSRHNVGFLVVDELARRYGARVTDKGAKSLVGRIRVGERELVLAKPQTMMNLSGLAAKALRAKYDVPLERTLIVHDDLDVPFGRLRLPQLWLRLCPWVPAETKVFRWLLRRLRAHLVAPELRRSMCRG